MKTAQARLSEVSFTEEEGVQLTDPNANVADGEGAPGGVKKFPGSNIVITGADVGRLAQVKSAEFIKSSSKESECPREGHPEIALVGRSNVGKSSLINVMVNRKELAQTSKKPGQRTSSSLSPNEFVIGLNLYWSLFSVGYLILHGFEFAAVEILW